MFSSKTNHPLAWSFSREDLRVLFRDNVIGGNTSVYHRHIHLNNEKSPKNARIAPNGDKFTSVSFWDFNR